MRGECVDEAEIRLKRCSLPAACSLQERFASAPRANEPEPDALQPLEPDASSINSQHVATCCC